MKTEINLISPQAKAERLHTIVVRRMNAIGDAILISLVLVACSYGAVYWSLSEISTSVDQRTDTNKEEYAKLDRELRDSRRVFAAAQSRILQNPLWTPLISDIVRAIPPEILITKLQLSENPRTVSLVGKATQGSAVVQYQRELEKLPWVDHVVAPLQNFAVSPNATVTFTIFRTLDQFASGQGEESL